MTNQERVGKGLEMLRDGLAPYIAREVEGADVLNRRDIQPAAAAISCSKISPH